MHSIAWWPILIAVSIATITDLIDRRIPNSLVAPLLLSGVIVSTVTRGWAGLGQGVLGVLLAVFVLGILYWLGGMGMGDVKLCAAIGAWIGPHQLVFALLMMAFAGGMMALVWATTCGFLKESLNGVSDLIFGIGKRGLRPHEVLVIDNPKARTMPYAPAIAAGTILSFFALAR